MRIMMIANDTTFAYNLRREILQRLVGEGHQVTLAAHVLQFKEELEEIGCKVIHVETGRRGKNPLKDIALLRRYCQILRNECPDIVFTNNIKPNVYAGLACKWLRKKYIANICGLGTPLENPGLMQKLTIFLYRIGVSGASCVFFQNNENICFFRKHHMLSSGAQTVLLPGSGVNLQAHPLLPYSCIEESTCDSFANQNNDNFLFIGRIMQDKGVRELFKAATLLKKECPNVTFDIVGGSDENFSDELRDLEEKEIIRYWGHQLDVLPFIRKCSAVVLPSYHEGMSNVLLEAAAAGRPVLASNVPGCMETFDEGVSGFGFAPKNAEALYQTMKKFVLMDDVKKRAMGLAARKKMVDHFDRNLVVSAYLKEIRKLEDQSHATV